MFFEKTDKIVHTGESQFSGDLLRIRALTFEHPDGETDLLPGDVLHGGCAEMFLKLQEEFPTADIADPAQILHADIGVQMAFDVMQIALDFSMFRAVILPPAAAEGFSQQPEERERTVKGGEFRLLRRVKFIFERLQQLVLQRNFPDFPVVETKER